MKEYQSLSHVEFLPKRRKKRILPEGWEIVRGRGNPQDGPSPTLSVGSHPTFYNVYLGIELINDFGGVRAKPQNSAE